MLSLGDLCLLFRSDVGSELIEFPQHGMIILLRDVEYLDANDLLQSNKQGSGLKSPSSFL